MKIKITTSRDAEAFTLIEMILAIGVAAIVLVVINATFFSALHMRGAAQNLVDGASPVNLALTTMRHDLQGAVQPNPNGYMSGDFKVGDISTVGIGDVVSLELFTTTGALMEDVPWGEVQRVTYGLKAPVSRDTVGKDLIRTVTRNLLGSATLIVVDQWMMGGVEKIDFECYDGQQWLNTWDTTGTTSLNTNLPVAVRVRIQEAQGGNQVSTLEPIEMIVPIDTQVITNRTDYTTY